MPKGNQDIRFEDVPKGKLHILNGKKIRESYHDRRKREAEQKARKRTALPYRLEARTDVSEEGPRKKSKRDGVNIFKGGDTDQNQKPLALNERGEEEFHEGVDASKLKIRPGESLRDFNRRVEDAYKFEISRAVRQVARSGRGERRKARMQTLREQAQQEGSQDAATVAKRKANAQAAEAREKAEQKDLRAQRDGLRRGEQAERDFETAPLRKGVREVAQAPPALNVGKLASLANKQAAAGSNQQSLEQERERAVQAYRLHKERQSLKRQV